MNEHDNHYKPPNGVNPLLKLSNDSLLDRLSELAPFKPTHILVIGLTDHITSALHKAYPHAKIRFMTYEQYVNRQTTSYSYLFDLVCVCCMYVSHYSLKDFLGTIHQLAKIGSVILLAFLGVGSLETLASPALQCLDIHTLGDAMIKTQWHEPVLDSSRFLMHYPNKSVFLNDLNNLNLAQLSDHLSHQFNQHQEPSLNWEILYARAWKKKEGYVADEKGHVAISIKHLLQSPHA